MVPCNLHCSYSDNGVLLCNKRCHETRVDDWMDSVFLCKGKFAVKWLGMALGMVNCIAEEKNSF